MDQLIDMLGVRDRIPEGATVRFEWGHLPTGEAGLALVLAVLAAVALTIWLYRREGSASIYRKSLLALVRVLVFAVALTVYLEPRLAIDLERKVEGHTIVLWDTSLSMSMSDKYVEPGRGEAMAKAAGLSNPADLAALSRQELAWRVVENAKLLEGLGAKNHLVLYGFDAQPTRLEPSVFKEGLEPKGAATDMATAVRRALEETGGRGVAAVVVVSDGRVNKGEGAQGVVAALEGRGIPFYAIGVGDPTPPKNLEVVEATANPRVMLGDPLVLEGTIRARGHEGLTVEVLLTVRPQEGGEPTELERRPVVMPADMKPLRLRFQYEPQEAGDLVFELTIPPRDDEPVTDDNSRSVPVKVTEDKTKVLLIAGGPSFEYHFLKTRLIREKSAVVSCWLQSADPGFPQEGNEHLTEMPQSLEALRPFDAIILLDPSPVAFDATIAAALKSYVADTRGGLLFIPGTKHAATFFQQSDLKPFRDLLPIIPGDLLEGRITATERWPLKATPDGRDHAATRLDPDPTTCGRIWAQLPGPFFSYPVAREKAGAVVLVRHENPSGMTERGARPVVAVHFFDGGPVIYQGLEETWRWRSVAPKVYDRYWVNVLRFLVQGRLAGGRKRVELLADREIYFLGQPIRIRAHAFDRSYRPLEVDQLTARAKAGTEETDVVLTSAKGRGQAGWYEATFLPPAQGELEFTLRLPDDDPGAPPESLKVTVRRPDLEFSNPRLDEELLSGIAAATSGALVAPLDVAALPEAIDSLTEDLVIAGTPIPLWDRWETIALICLLLGFEWALRKRSKMV